MASRPITLPQLMAQCAGLRDRLDVRSLGNLSMACRDLNEVAWRSDAYRQQFLLQTRTMPPPPQPPGTNYRQLCQGSSGVTLARLYNRDASLTQADVDAYHAFRRAFDLEPDNTPTRVEDVLQVPPPPSQLPPDTGALAARRWRLLWSMAGVSCSAAMLGSALLFFCGAMAAGAVAPLLLMGALGLLLAGLLRR